MATTTPSAKTLDSAQRAWLKKMGAALDVRLGGVALKTPSAAPGASAPDLKSTAAPAAPPDPKKQDAKKDVTAAQAAAPSKDSTAAAGPKISVAGKPLLIKGAKGNDVKDLQTLLNKHGATLNVDGDFGKLTEEAVREFQKKNPPLAVDGKVGEKTWTALGKDPETPPAPPDTKPRRVVVIVTDSATNNAVDKAEVTIADQSENTGNTGQATLSLAPGKHPFGVSAPGFKQGVGTVDVTTQEETQLRVELERKAPQSITIKPQNPPPLAPQGTQQFTATDDSGADVTGQVLWDSSDPKIISIDTRGLATAKGAPGTVTITATVAPAPGGASKTLVGAPTPPPSASTNVKVSAPAPLAGLKNISIVPDDVLVEHVGLSTVSPQLVGFRAIGEFFTGPKRNITQQVKWAAASTSPGVVVTLFAPGLFQVNVTGSATITASHPANPKISGTAKLKVVQRGNMPALQSIQLQPSAHPVLVADPHQLRAIGTFAGGSKHDVTNDVNWTSSDAEIIDLNENEPGSAIPGLKGGTAVITATPKFGSAAPATVSLVVRPPGVQSITIDPQNSTISNFDPVPFTANATPVGGGKPRDVTAHVKWSTSDDKIITIDPSGQATAIASGKATITADHSSGKSGSTNVTTAVPALVKITIDVQPPSVPAGLESQLTATGEFDDNSTLNLTRSVRWAPSSFDATIDSNGRFKCMRNGKVEVLAFDSRLAQPATATVVVTAPSSFLFRSSPIRQPSPYAANVSSVPRRSFPTTRSNSSPSGLSGAPTSEKSPTLIPRPGSLWRATGTTTIHATDESTKLTDKVDVTVR